jgi:biopolymer transport protein ExbB/TolQ
MIELSLWDECWTWFDRNYCAGGWGMYPITLWLVIAFAIIVERVWVLGRCSVRPEAFLDEVKLAVMSGDLSSAVRACEVRALPLARVVRQGLVVAHEPRSLVQGEMDVAGMAQSRRLWARTPFLALLGNLAMLSGLLGTMTGLVKSYGSYGPFGSLGGESVDPSQKARVLAEGLSEAMHCTAFGLAVAVLCVAAFTVLRGRTQRIQNDIDAHSTYVMNLVLTNLHRMQPVDGEASCTDR